MVLIWTVNFVIAKVALRYLSPFALAPFRVTLAAVLMLLIYRVLRDKFADHPGPAKLEKRDWAWFALLGALGVAGNQMLFAIGLSFTTIGHSSLIIGAGPITILLLARLMRLELLTIRKLAGMMLCFVGVLILALEHGLSMQSGTLKGDLITGLGSMSFCLYAVLSKKVSRRYDTMQINLYSFLAGGLIALPLAVWQGSKLDWAGVHWAGWAGLLYMALFASVIAYILFYWALRHMAASRLSAFTYLQPILATLLGVVTLDEPVTRHLVWGGAFILVGVYLAERVPRHAGAQPAAPVR
jgi:drug/metabolite transporter (DMT)-like permease